MLNQNTPYISFFGHRRIKKILDEKGKTVGMGNMGEMMAKGITYHQVYTFDRKIKELEQPVAEKKISAYSAAEELLK